MRLMTIHFIDHVEYVVQKRRWWCPLIWKTIHRDTTRDGVLAKLRSQTIVTSKVEYL